MSTKYPGGIITKNYVAPTPSSASGIWTLEQQEQAQQAGIWPFGGPFNFIEDVFSTYLYNGTGASRTIVNGIDESGKGALTWIKGRSIAYSNVLFDTTRGAGKYLQSNSSGVEQNFIDSLSSFNANGFSLGSDSNGVVNTSGQTYASWTFREQAKFFDVVTFTGNGTTQSIAHNLGSTPGFVIIKSTTQASDWRCFHRSTPTGYLFLSSPDPLETISAENVYGNNSTVVAPTSTTITVGSSGAVNGSGETFVAYIFAHNAGGFGTSNTDNVISCGTFTTDAGGVASVNLGYEPQLVIFKRTNSATFGNWYMIDNMRGFTNPSGSSWLWANATNAEQTNINFAPESTGFNINFVSSAPFIYVAIRRGPMKVPTTGTNVFTPILTGSGATLSDSYASIGFPTDMTLRYQTGTNTDAAFKNAVYTRLMGMNTGAGRTPTSANNPNLLTHSTAAEITTYYLSQNGSMGMDYGGAWNAPDYVLTHLHFKRAPGFFDVVCYTGNNTAQAITHNLTVVPELIILKSRVDAFSWCVYSKTTAPLELNLNAGFAAYAAGVFNNTAPTSTQFTAIANNAIVVYLFATCAGVSKVGSYTGTGAAQTINCGFTAGARFVLIKRTDAAGDWYVWDSARGIIPANDPYLLLNSTAAEVTGTDYVDTTAVGFDITSTAPAAINANGGTFIFLAIA
jgi:hypothetical protein